MYYMVMVIALLLGQQPDIDRSFLDMIGEPEPLQASPAETNNRLENSVLRNKIEDKALALAIQYRGNEIPVRIKLVSRKMMDWIYSLPEIKGALNQTEIGDLTYIIHAQISIALKAEQTPKKTEPPVVKQWFWSNYGGYNVQIYGWLDGNGQIRYNLNEQQPHIQAIILQGQQNGR